jgi:micrococcal nuclease
MRTVLTLALVLSALSLTAQAPVPKAAVPVATGFLGNKESKVFHLPTCKLVVKIKPENKVTFATREEAKAAGYAPCKICIK